MTQKKILVPIDFSGCSIKALEVAVHLAKKINGKLVILNACPKPVVYADSGTMIHAENLFRESEDNAKSAFESVETSLRLLQDVEYTFQVKHDFTLDAITSLAAKSSIDLIVMGTTGAGGVKGMLFGSNTYKVIKNAPCPVMAIPEAAEVGKVFKNIVLAGDYQNTASKETFEPLMDIANVSGAEIHVLHVSETPEIKSGESEEAQKLDRYFKNLKHSFHFKIDQHVDEGINEYIDENNIDLLTLVAKKHNLLDRLFKSSTTRKMAYHSQTPLLILHPD